METKIASCDECFHSKDNFFVINNAQLACKKNINISNLATIGANYEFRPEDVVQNFKRKTRLMIFFRLTQGFAT